MIIDEKTQTVDTTPLPKMERAIETILAMNCLAELEEGQICPYAKLREVTGLDPQDRKKGYGYVKSARRALEHERDWVLEAVPNEGIKRCHPHDVINRGGRDLKHTRRHIKASIRRASTLVPIERQESLTPAERSKFLFHLSHFGVLNQMMKPSSVKRITAAVEVKNSLLPPADALRLFINGKPDKDS